MAVAKKPAAKKATKPAAKKTTTKAAKPAAKKTTAKSTVKAELKKVAPIKTSSSEISVTGNKKIGTLKKEFNQKFNYIRLYIYDKSPADANAKGERLYELDHDKTLASVRKVNSGGTISINGNKKVKTLEKEFEKVFGLYAQVGWVSKDNILYYSVGISDEKTLAQINEDCKKDGHVKSTKG